MQNFFSCQFVETDFQINLDINIWTNFWLWKQRNDVNFWKCFIILTVGQFNVPTTESVQKNKYFLLLYWYLKARVLGNDFQVMFQWRFFEKHQKCSKIQRNLKIFHNIICKTAKNAKISINLQYSVQLNKEVFERHWNVYSSLLIKNNCFQLFIKIIWSIGSYSKFRLIF